VNRIVYAKRGPSGPRFVFLAILAAAFTLPFVRPHAQSPTVFRWGVFETSFTSARAYENPLQDAGLFVTFTSPSRQAVTVRGFWDGDNVWRVRFSPDELGTWTFTSRAFPESDAGLHNRSGTFGVVANPGTSRFDRHGPIRVAASRTFLEHADGTPFFWLADTAWNGALRSTPDEWQLYIDTRLLQGFSAVQWVATQWRASPQGDRLGELAFTGTDRIAVNPAFFQRLDAKAVALNRAGLLNVPVLLWSIGGGSTPSVNPGVALSDDQAARLAQYMVARWQAYDVAWILPGDGDYRGARAGRWRRIGRDVFGHGPHAPVLLHPGGMHWVLSEFLNEPWLDVHGYQSGHGDDERALRWMTEGPPSTDWGLEPRRPFINLEPPYERHLSYQSKQPISPDAVRRAVYWSLLNAPIAGVSYGGHGVWGWDDGSAPPTDHAGSGTPLPWKQALVMPGAEQMEHVANLFTSIDYWRLRPAPTALVDQPGTAAPHRFIAVAASPERDLLLAYTPAGDPIALTRDVLPAGAPQWIDPRTGARATARPASRGNVAVFAPPDAGDWLLLAASGAR
jgi:hypothetical protein